MPEGRSHRNCTIERCIAHHIEGGKYPTKHAKMNCDCGNVKVPVEKVTRILSDGGIPVIRSSPCIGHERPFINVAQYRLGISFCAFTHVWSDGLGSCQQNSLPTCQLRRLCDAARAMTISEKWPLSAINRVVHSDSVYIWIDTLCIQATAGYDGTSEKYARTRTITPHGFTPTWVSKSRSQDLS